MLNIKKMLHKKLQTKKKVAKEEKPADNFFSYYCVSVLNHSYMRVILEVLATKCISQAVSFSSCAN